MTDPNLPARLAWAASQVDNILRQDVWDRFGNSLGAGGSFTDRVSDSLLLIGLEPPGIWTGLAAKAHTQELLEAAQTARTAKQDLEALADTLREQARFAGDRIEREALEARITEWFAGLNTNPYTY